MQTSLIRRLLSHTAYLGQQSVRPVDNMLFLGSPSEMLPSVAQVRAARGLLGWSRQELAEKSRLSTKSLQRLEDGLASPRASTLERLGRVMSEAGVQFLAETVEGGEGVRRRIST